MSRHRSSMWHCVSVVCNDEISRLPVKWAADWVYAQDQTTILVYSRRPESYSGGGRRFQGVRFVAFKQYHHLLMLFLGCEKHHPCGSFEGFGFALPVAVRVPLSPDKLENARTWCRKTPALIHSCAGPTVRYGEDDDYCTRDGSGEASACIKLIFPDIDSFHIPTRYLLYSINTDHTQYRVVRVARVDSVYRWSCWFLFTQSTASVSPLIHYLIKLNLLLSYWMR